MMNAFGEVLRQRRRNSGLTQQELAKRVGVDFSYISKLENGRVPAPGNKTIHRLVEALGKPAEDLIEAAHRSARGGNNGDPLESAAGVRAYSLQPDIEVLLFGAKEITLPESYHSHLLHGIQTEANRASNTKISFCPCSEPRFEQADLDRFSRRDGLILMMAVPRYMDAFEQVIKLGIPVVLAGRQLANRRLNCVLSDYYPACQELVDYLYDKGFRRFGWLGRDEHMPNPELRRDMIRGRLASKGLSVLPRDCLLLEQETTEYIIKFLENRFAEGDLPEVLICSKGGLVPLVQRAMASKGLACPDDLSLVCFDNHAFVQFCQPEPTRMATFPEEIGARSYRRVVELIRNGENENRPVTILVPTKLIEGGSVKLPGARPAASGGKGKRMMRRGTPIRQVPAAAP